ncbi:MAG: hypothetical protein AAGA42_22685 [Actinomycetota bacterium]
MTTANALPSPAAPAHSPMHKVIWMIAGAIIAVVASITMAQTWSADAAPGDEESTYVPVANCRVFDFRAGFEPAGGKKTPLGAGEAYTQQITGAVGDCTIPSDAVAVAMNVTVANGTAASNLRVFPADVSEVPNASSLNWTAGQSPTPNKVDVKLSPDGKIKLFNQNGTVDVLADIVGFYTSGELAELRAAVETMSGSQPFSVASAPLTLVATDITNATSVASVQVTAPVAGHVTLTSQARLSNVGASQEVRCSIGTFADAVVPGYIQEYEDAFGVDGSLAGTARFAIDADTTIDYHLVCDGSNGALVTDRLLTGIFTPAN